MRREVIVESGYALTSPTRQVAMDVIERLGKKSETEIRSEIKKSELVGDIYTADSLAAVYREIQNARRDLERVRQKACH